MNKEIKEILDYIDDRIIPNEKWNKIKDYMINLQHIEEQHKKLNGELRKENEKLKEDNLLIKSAVKLVSDNYKSRIDKAIELINIRKEEQDNGIGWVTMRIEQYFEEFDEVINILNGSDENGN